MALDPTIYRALLRRVENFEAAVRAHEMKGSLRIAHAIAVEEDFIDTKADLIAAIRSLAIQASN